jgi:hypothetical protein
VFARMPSGQDSPKTPALASRPREFTTKRAENELRLFPRTWVEDSASKWRSEKKACK